jgi:hypothetical protein
MAKTIVDRMGQMRTIVDSRQIQLEKQYDLMEDALRNAETVFTKRSLMSMYGLRTPDFWAFLKLMESRECLAVESPVTHKTGARVTFTEKCWKILTANGKKSRGRKHSAATKNKISAANQQRRPEVFDRMRATWSKKPKRTHCSAGHSLHDAYIRSTGQRVCRICASQQNARRHFRSG